MAAQQAGYEAQRRLNQQMMEMMQRMYPNEVFPNVPDPDLFLGIYSSEYTEGLIPRNFPRDSFLEIFRGKRSSDIPDENSEEHFVGTSEDWTVGKLLGIYRGRTSSVYSEELSDELVVLGVSSEIRFLGIPSEISERFPRKNEFPKSYFRGLVSSRDGPGCTGRLSLAVSRTGDGWETGTALGRLGNVPMISQTMRGR
uniref:Uncharacterized protein n=1 Tax=Brassica oleracea var. oleracea TaxID=109376 RepID=A0A0D3D7Y5_BRAOL